MYTVIYDGDCNLCSNLVQLLEKLDRGQTFTYLPMQDQAGLNRHNITPQDCEMGMILLDSNSPSQKWQGSDAAEEIGRILPLTKPFITAYRTMGLKPLGDSTYIQVRDNRYNWFGRRRATYQSQYPDCIDGNCDRALSPTNTTT
jgi:predicted DCC family thiol-disulfide oxidoreductase YuxK